MNVYRIITNTVCFVACLTWAVSTRAQPSVQSAAGNRERAAALWEDAIRAKGGHERLQAIENLLISSTVDIRTERGDVVMETERLYVMPGKAWIYTCTPRFDVSVDATVINSERKFCMVTLSPARGGVTGLSNCLPTTGLHYLVQDPVIYLMETKWVRPVPIGVRPEGEGKKLVDVIETEIGKLRVDFYLDPKTRLPFKLVTDEYNGVSELTQPIRLTVELSDYVVVDGIQLPARVTRRPYVDPKAEMTEPAPDLLPTETLPGNQLPAPAKTFRHRRDTENARYRFNVAYDAKIFEGPAPKNVKSTDWKPR